MKKVVLALVALLWLPIVSFAQLSGTYTINPNGSGSSNYTSITAAVSALTSNGVNGPVTFNIADGTYNDYIYIASTINGLSSTNTITFDGGSAADVEFKGSYGVYINGQDWITVKNVTMTPSSVYGVYLYGADNNTIENCIINGNLSTSSTSYYGVYIYTSQNDTIRNCEIYGMYYGAYIYGTSNSSFNSNGNAIINNVFKKQWDYPIYNYYSSQSLIEGNTIDSTREGSFGYKLYCGYSNQTKIKRNKMYFTGSDYGYGMYFVYENYYPTSSSSSYRTLVENNFVGGSGGSYTRPIFMSSLCYRLDILHNTLVSNGASTSSYGIYCSSGTGRNIQNNNVYMMNSGSGYAMYITSASYIDTLDYNNIHNNSSSYYAYFTAARADLAAWKSAGSSSGFNQNDTDVTIGYVNGREWDLEPVALNNIANRWVGTTEDINGNARPTSPDTDNDIGCLDYYLPPNDAGVNGYPVTAACAGTTTVEAIIKNYGTNTLTGVTLNWAISVNGGSYTTQTSSSYSGSLASGGLDTVTLGSFTMQNGKVYTIKSWTTNPNSNTDGKASNDTSYTTMAPAIAGTFTVGGTGADYSKLSDAIADLTNYGACGPVTLRMSSGSFNERVVIPQIAGASSANPIRIVGQGKDNTRITYSSSSTSDYQTVLLDGADFITFDSLTIQAASTNSYGATVWFTNGADSNTVTNCNLLGDANTNSTWRLNVVFSGSSSSYSTSGTSGQGNTINGCLIRGGYFNVSLYGSGNSSISTYNLGNSFTNNELYKAYYYGFYFLYSGQKNIVGNTIDSLGTSNGYAMRNFYCSRDRIIGNVMNGNAYGMYQYYANYTGYTSADTTYIFNNMFSATGTAGLYLYGNYQTLTYNNSVYCAGTYGAYFGIPYYGSVTRNNSFHCDGTYAVYLSTTSTLVSSSFFDYNNYYAPNGSVVYHGSSSYVYSDLATWFSNFSSHNANSISSNPDYFNTSTTNGVIDLHSLSVNLNNRGASLWHITDDIDGQTRPAAPDLIPDIGADEYYLPPYDLDVVSIAPGVFASGNNTISITVKNTGINDIVNDTALVSYTVGSGSAVKDSIFITSLKIGSDTTFEFNMPYNVTSSTPSSFTICGNIDGGIAGDPDTDDEVCNTVCVGTSGSFTIDASGNGDFTTFGSAVSALSGCGIAGNVTFNVAAGTYNEQVIIGSINGVGPNATITFRGAGVNSVTLKNTATGSSDWATVLLNGADYIRFEDMTIEAAGTSYGATVWFTGGADYNEITNCNLIAQQGVNASSTSRQNVVFSASTASTSSGGVSGNYNTIQGCLINGGYSNVNLYGSTTSAISGMTWGNSFINNQMINAYYYGVYAYYGFAFTTLKGNFIDNIYSSSGYGVYFYLYHARCRVIGNTINGRNYGYYQYVANYTGTTADDSNHVFNNMITATGSYGIYSSLGYYTKWYHNSVYSAGAYGAYFGTPYYSQSRNNIFYGNGSYAVYLGTTSTLVPNDFFDYNCYYAPNGSIAYHGSAQSDLSTWISNYGSHNANSIELDPQFVDKTNNLHTRSLNLNNAGMNLALVTTDIDGETRPLAPDVTVDIGADEYYLPPWDADLQNVGPMSLVAGNNTITAEFLNDGTTTWNGDTIYVEYTVDGGNAVKDTVITGSVANGSVQNFSFTAPYNQTTGGPWKEVGVRINPAFKTDPDTTADTLYITACTPASGTYVVDASGNGDFLTVAAAAEYLSCAQIVGPVTVRIKDGTYSEQVALGALNGASATNTVRFVGESLNARIAGNFGVNDNYTLKLDGAKFVTLDSLTISNANNDGVALFLTNSADSNNVTNSNIAANAATTSTASTALRISQLSTSSTATGVAGSYNTIDNCRITGGYYGYTVAGNGSTTASSFGNTVRNCTFDDAYYMAMLAYYSADDVFDGNSVEGIRVSSGYSICELQGLRSQITNNVCQHGSYGIFIDGENTISTSDTSAIVNNMCSNFDDANNQIGIYAAGYGIHIIHNSIWANSSSASTTNPSLYINSYSGCVVKNNVIANTSTSLAVSKFGTFAIGAVDYNAYYVPNFTIPFYDGTTYGDLTSWQTDSTRHNVNSIMVNPG
ncbi:MAG: right-handed parallel beta-helix repeat-containing protein, partial [Bacteroidetes bacterium]|nr:right-handed parallel beta-helix repeat-containing protein [Bacteroidota bacterium]